MLFNFTLPYIWEGTAVNVLIPTKWFSGWNIVLTAWRKAATAHTEMIHAGPFAMRAAFLVWNPFQVQQFYNIAKLGKDVTFIIIDRKENKGQFGKSVQALMPGQVEYLSSKKILEIDGRFDVVFFQAPFRAMEELRKTRLVSVQYGLAKEAHNYGTWRSLADLNLMYGQYSCERVTPFSPSIAIGNPKFDGWRPPLDPASKIAAKLRMGFDPAKKLLLYMPTWGDLSSFQDLLPQFGALNRSFEIALKMHHNNEFKLVHWRELASASGIRHIFDGAADQLKLLSCADLVISDYSGAIFDATYARLPVVLYQPRPKEHVGIQKFTLDSLEFARRNEIGLVCHTPSDFGDAVKTALESSVRIVQRAESLREKLFVDVDKDPAGASAWKAIENLLSGKLPGLTKPQMVLRRQVKTARRRERRIATFRRNLLAMRNRTINLLMLIYR